MQNSPFCEVLPDERLQLIAASYSRATGKELVAVKDRTQLRRALWEAPCAIVAHGKEDDPIFFYGNRLALILFEMDFAAFTRLPSRCSAEPVAQEERAKLLQRVTQQGYVDDYSGVRVTHSGKRFRITGATVWNLVDIAGAYCGQAATFSDSRPL